MYFNNGKPDDWINHQRVSNSRYNSTTALFNDIKNRERGTEFENSSYPYPDLLKKEYKDYYVNREIIEVNNIPYSILHLKKGFYIKYVLTKVGKYGKVAFM